MSKFNMKIGTLVTSVENTDCVYITISEYKDEKVDIICISNRYANYNRPFLKQYGRVCKNVDISILRTVTNPIYLVWPKNLI